MNTSISDNARVVLAEIYKQYLEKEDLDLPDATSFDSDFADTCMVFGKAKPNTVHRTLGELKKIGFIKLFIDDSFELTDNGIAFMDEQFNRKVDKVLSFISGIVGKFVS